MHCVSRESEGEGALALVNASAPPIGGQAEIPFPFQHAFTLNPRAVGDEAIEVPVDTRQTASRGCPNREETTVSCTTALTGTLRLVRLGPAVVEGGDPRDREDYPPLGPLGPEEDDDDGIIAPLGPPQLAPRATLGRGGREARVKVRCTGGCAMRIFVWRAPRKRGAGRSRGRARARGSQVVATAAAAKPLARKHVTIRAGRRGWSTIAVGLSPAARSALRAGGVRLDVTVTPARGGRALRRSFTLRAG